MSAASNVKRIQLPVARSGIVGSDALLSTLQSAHRQTDAVFAEMDRVATSDAADQERFNHARFRIAQANLARRRLVDQICRHLTLILSAGEGELVRELSRRDEACFRNVAEFVRQWAPEVASGDWGGYRVSLRAMRAEILLIVSAEARLLYQLLERTS